MTDKTLDEHAEAVKRLDAVDARLAEVFGPRPESVRAVRDAYEAERAARVAARAALQGVADVVDPNGDHYFWRKKEADLAGTVKSIMEDRERIDAEWRKRAQLGMCVMDAPNGPECWCGAPSEVEAGLCLRHARELERLSHAEKAEARVRELEAERDEISALLAKVRAERDASRASEREALVRINAAWADAYTAAKATGRGEDPPTVYGPGPTIVAEAGLSVSETVRRHDEATLAETRAQLARLREAVKVALQDLYEGRHTCPVCDGGDTDDGCAHETACGLGALAAALADLGPTLAEIRRAAQVEVLRELAKEMAPPAAPTMGSATWDAWRERIARQFGTFDAVAIHDWLRQRADDLERRSEAATVRTR